MKNIPKPVGLIWEEETQQGNYSIKSSGNKVITSVNNTDTTYTNIGLAVEELRDTINSHIKGQRDKRYDSSIAIRMLETVCSEEGIVLYRNFSGFSIIELQGANGEDYYVALSPRKPYLFKNIGDAIAHIVQFLRNRGWEHKIKEMEAAL